MTTKLIAVLIIALFCFGGWRLFFYWEKVKNEEVVAQKEAAAAAVVGDQLPGVPHELEQSLRAAEAQGAAALGNWLKVHGRSIQEPRKTWIELDYCVLLSRADPASARRLFAEIKSRTPPTSPVWPRIQRLEKTYQ
jgi:hypothetical protein